MEGELSEVRIRQNGEAPAGTNSDTTLSFNSKGWNEHSVLQPKILSIQHPDLICPLSPSVFFWPTWTKAHARYMHEPINEAEEASLRSNMTMFGGAMYENQLSIHAWGMHDYLARLTPEIVQERNTRFNVLLREVAGARLSWS